MIHQIPIGKELTKKTVLQMLQITPAFLKRLTETGHLQLAGLVPSGKNLYKKGQPQLDPKLAQKERLKLEEMGKLLNASTTIIVRWSTIGLLERLYGYREIRIPGKGLMFEKITED